MRILGLLGIVFGWAGLMLVPSPVPAIIMIASIFVAVAGSK